MSTIEDATNKSETEQLEHNLAFAWHEGTYNEAQAKLSAEERGLNFINVTVERSKLYEIDAKAGAVSWN